MKLIKCFLWFAFSLWFDYSIEKAGYKVLEKDCCFWKLGENVNLLTFVIQTQQCGTNMKLKLFKTLKIRQNIQIGLSSNKRFDYLNAVMVWYQSIIDELSLIM